MELASLLTFVDLLFPLGGIGVTAGMLIRRVSTEEAAELPPPSLAEMAATVVALLATAVGPNILVVALTPGMPEMPALSKFALVPSVVVLLGLLVISKLSNWPRLWNRIWTGIWVGAAATGTLDAVRLTGFSLGFMPGNMPRMFGVLILDTMAQGPSMLSDIVGYIYHYWAGACFGLTLALLLGKTRWWAGVIWALIIEVGMMTTPPMVVAMDTGYFGSKTGPGLFIVSLTAHIVYGIFLGLLAQKYVSHKGNLFRLVLSMRRWQGTAISNAKTTG